MQVRKRFHTIAGMLSRIDDHRLIDGFAFEGLLLSPGSERFRRHPGDTDPGYLAGPPIALERHPGGNADDGPIPQIST
jgi:hypothetical protein